jgi:hypothetical protein
MSEKQLNVYPISKEISTLGTQDPIIQAFNTRALGLHTGKLVNPEYKFAVSMSVEGYFNRQIHSYGK